MPRKLDEVIHYWLPEGGDRDGAGAAETLAPGRLPALLPVLCAPLGDRDVLRAALLWNLVVEVARLGGRAVLVTPDRPGLAAAWPGEGMGPVGAELVRTRGADLGELRRAALDVAVERAADALEGGLVVVPVPARWLLEPDDAGSLLRWTLLLSGTDRRELLETYGLAKLLWAGDPNARVGVALHGVRRRREAEDAFERLAGAGRRHLGRPLASYGRLVDDLHVYRAIVARRPVGLAHPASPAARALRDVAGLLLADARESAVV